MENFRHSVCCFHYERQLFGKVSEYWAAAIKFIRAREFFAEFLGTFVLLVSCYNDIHTCILYV